MAPRVFINNQCPVCKNYVDTIPDVLLKKEGDNYDVEFIVLKRGIKQYYHSTCWHKMIAEMHGKEPANA